MVIDGNPLFRKEANLAVPQIIGKLLLKNNEVSFAFACQADKFTPAAAVAVSHDLQLDQLRK